jgi:hypothetical protein
MKKLTILLFSILISFSSYGEWTLVTGNKDGSTKFYIDTDTIREYNSYVYYCELGDSTKPKGSSLSAKFYNELDCGVRRVRTLSYTFYRESMGIDKINEVVKGNPEWKYPQPRTIDEYLLDYACNYVK